MGAAAAIVNVIYHATGTQICRAPTAPDMLMA
jgi:CO/xanthine dehydrogenase Mo-binding subunit